MTERYSLPDFIEFCTRQNASVRYEGEIFWFNRIPVPNILVRNLFFSADIYFKDYVFHLLSGTILALHDLAVEQWSGLIFADLNNQKDQKLFHLFPDPSQKELHIEVLKKIWGEIQAVDKFKEFEHNVSLKCGLGHFEIGLDDFLNCIGHKGKKYERLYYPDDVKNLIETYFPKVTEFLTRGNGDMFGNVVVDRLNIYRSGFSDAFASIFNRLLDFKFESFPLINPKSALQGQTEIVSVREVGTIKLVEYAGGNWWQPSLEQGGAIGVEIDKNHPLNFVDEKSQLHLLLLALSKEEMLIFEINQKEVIEEFRFRVSQSLKKLANNLD
jgi:hypothetical protein